MVIYKEFTLKLNNEELIILMQVVFVLLQLACSKNDINIK